jgi:hypothetical protein
MTSTRESGAPPSVVPDTVHTVVPETDSSAVKAADRWLFIGAALTGSMIFSPIGLVVLVIGFVKSAQARRSGEFVRPTAVTLFGMFAMCDAAGSAVGWSLDIWAHDTRVVQWGLTGWGRLVDGAYYLDYNSLSMGGAAGAGEKSWIAFCVMCVFPARMAAAYGFLKLKRWGYQWMIITSWAYIFLWLGYLVNMLANFPERFGASVFGVTGWWVFDIWYMTPFVILPWLYALDKRRWCRT